MCKPSSTKTKKISMDLVKKIEPYFDRLEVLSIHGFGEPLLGDIEYFVEQSIKHDFIIHMNTTGSFLSERKAEILAKTRLSIRFSIHAGTKETYNNIMGGDFDRVLKNISYFMQKLERNGIQNDIWFSYLVMKDNIDEIESFLHIASDCGVKRVRFMRLSPAPSRFVQKMRDRDYVFKYQEQSSRNVTNRFVENMPHYEAIASKLGIVIEPSSMVRGVDHHFLAQFLNKCSSKLLGGRKIFPFSRRKGTCLAPWFGQMLVNQEGDVNLCCASPYRLGNINDNSLDEIWNSKKMRKIRNSFKKGCYPQLCGYCDGFGFSEYPINSSIRNLTNSNLSRQ